MKSPLRRLVLARLLSETGATAALFVGIWGTATFVLGATPGQMALITACWGLASTAGNMAGGLLVDRFDPRRVLVIGEVIAVPATLALVAADSVSLLMLLVVPSTFSGGLINAAVGSFPPFMARGEADLARTNSALEMSFALAFAAGPGLGAAVAKVAGLDWIFVVNAATSAVALPLLLGIPIRAAAQGERGRALLELRDGVRVALRNRSVRSVLLVGLATWLSFGCFMALEPLFYREVLRSGPTLLGVVLTIFGAGVIAGAWLVGRIPVRLISVGSLVLLGLVMGASEILYTATSHLAPVVAGNIVWGIAIGAFAPMARTIVHATTEEAYVGRVIGTLGVSQRIGTLVPLTFVGALAAAAGVQRVLVGAGIAMITFACVVLPRARRADAERTAGIEAMMPPHPAEPEPAYKGLA